jgi:diguanylate cyclase (GGDEF)-like protein
MSIFFQNIFIYTLFLLGYVSLLQWMENYFLAHLGVVATHLAFTTCCLSAIYLLVCTVNPEQPYTRIFSILLVVFTISIIKSETKWEWLLQLSILLLLISPHALQTFNIFTHPSGYIFAVTLSTTSYFINTKRKTLLSNILKFILSLQPVFISALWVVLDHNTVDTDILTYCISFQWYLFVSYLFTRHTWHDEQNVKKLQLLTDIDELTQIGNFRAFESALNSVDEQLRTNQIPYTIVSLDIDHFKKINDTFGHINGNIVLQQTAMLLSSYCDDLSTEATVYRTGGEEFTLILLTGTLTKNKPFQQFIHHLEQGMAQQVFQLDAETLTHLSFSCGATEANQSDDSPIVVYKRADSYLYMAKQNGRNGAFIEGHRLS